MGLFTPPESQLEVQVIGTDGIRRCGKVDRSAQMAFNKYEIDKEAIFLQMSSKFGGLIKIAQPTIQFYEDSIYPIPSKGRKSTPTPSEAGDAIGNASFALLTLLRGSEKAWQTIVILLLAGALLVAGAGAYFGYDNMQKQAELSAKVDAMLAPSLPVISPGGAATPSVTAKPTAVPTPVIPHPTFAGG